ncbi:unnamed protein product [Orchesella dallaii]|uniref:EF-hand domain-containing protein n=1 Tax=Orchesella dallaii TaxID=48710 RepID=A0ABP1QDB5_9HEXA
MAVLTNQPKSESTMKDSRKSIMKVGSRYDAKNEPMKASFEDTDSNKNDKKGNQIVSNPKRKKVALKARKSATRPAAEQKGLAKLHRLLSAADYLTKITHFTVEELEQHGRLDRMRMREVLHVVFEITDGVMLDLAYKAFDRDSDNWVWLELNYEIILLIAACLEGCIVPGYGVEAEEAEECEREIIELAMRKLDIDKDGQITHEDFVIATKADPLLLVAVGPCLPPVKCCAAFMALVTEKFRHFTGPLGTKEVEKKSKNAHSGLAHSARRLSVIGLRIEKAKTQQSVRAVPQVSHVKKLTENNELRFRILSEGNVRNVNSNKD